MTTTAENYEEALASLRAKLRLKRGYSGRIIKRLKVKRYEVYNVVYGRSKNPIILKALVDDAENSQTAATESFDIISRYLTGNAA